MVGNLRWLKASAAAHSRTGGATTGLLGEARGGVWRVFSRAGINVEHKKRVYLGVLGGADHNGRVRKAPFSTVDGLCVSRVSSSR